MSGRMVVVNTTTGGYFPTVKEAAESIGVLPSTMCGYLRRDNGKPIKGYYFMYKHILEARQTSGE